MSVNETTAKPRDVSRRVQPLVHQKWEDEDWTHGWDRWCLGDDRVDCSNDMERLGFDDAEKFSKIHSANIVVSGAGE